jgi:ferric-dicitrate binding protein FerR (iron transport regulator)
MTQERPPHGPERVETPDDPIARVLKFAGSRPQPDPDRKAEFKKTLRAEWHRVIEAGPRVESQSASGTPARAESRAESRAELRAGSSATSGAFGRAVPTRRAVVIAAGIAAVLLIAWLLPSRVVQPPVAPQVVGRVVRTEGVVHATVGEELHADTILDTGDTGRMALALGPGISLRMDVDSRIVMVGERTVRLERGAVYVDARAEKSGSVLVHTPHGDVRDIGTQFEVRARGSSFGVRVREGEILINRGGAEMTARAGEGLHLDRQGRYVRRTIPVFGPEWAWTSTIAPQFQLEGSTVQQFLDWVAREQGWRWRFADSDTARLAAGIVTHGSLEGYTPEEALAIVLPTCGLSFVRNGDEIVVSFAKESSPRD